MNVSTAATPSFSLKTLLRQGLGDARYRSITQTLRFGNYLLHPHYEAETASLPLLVKPGATCFDIGANYGHYTRLLSPLVGSQGAVHAFEPSSVTNRGLERAKRMLGWRNVRVERCALATEDGELTLTIPIKSHGGLGIALAHLGKAIDRPGITEQVPVRTLDGYMEANGIAACDFIKCDVEGAEFMVLQGGARTLSRYKPTLLLEIDATYLRRNDHTVADVETFLRGEGYDFFAWEQGALQKVDGLLDRRNTILVHPSRGLAPSRG